MCPPVNRLQKQITKINTQGWRDTRWDNLSSVLSTHLTAVRSGSQRPVIPGPGDLTPFPNPPQVLQSYAHAHMHTHTDN